MHKEGVEVVTELDKAWNEFHEHLRKKTCKGPCDQCGEERWRFETRFEDGNVHWYACPDCDFKGFEWFCLKMVKWFPWTFLKGLR